MKINIKGSVENEVASIFGIDEKVKVLTVEVDMHIDGLKTVRITLAPTHEDIKKVLDIFERYI